MLVVSSNPTINKILIYIDVSAFCVKNKNFKRMHINGQACVTQIVNEYYNNCNPAFIREARVGGMRARTVTTRDDGFHPLNEYLIIIE